MSIKSSIERELVVIKLTKRTIDLLKEGKEEETWLTILKNHEERKINEFTVFVIPNDCFSIVFPAFDVSSNKATYENEKKTIMCALMIYKSYLL